MSPRQSIGLLLLVAVGLAVLVAGAYRGHWTGGEPMADWPAPPPVGSCVGVPGGDETADVPCTSPHLQEVTRTVAAIDPQRAGAAEHWDTFCGDPSSSYVGSPYFDSDTASAPPTESGAMVWNLPRPQFAYGILRAPPADRRGDAGWLACIVRPQGRAAYIGSVRGLGDSPDRPAAFGSCGTGTGAPLGFSGVSCVDPHEWQIIGEWWGPSGLGMSADGVLVHTGDHPDASLLQDSCRSFAAQIVGARDPTYGGALDVDVDVAQSFQGGFTGSSKSQGSPASDAAPPATGAPDSGAPDNASDTVIGQYVCRIASADPGMQLTDGMERWGERPPPLRPVPGP